MGQKPTDQQVPNFEGRVALVTGAGRGIGRACAVSLARHGAQVGLVARSLNELVELEKEIADEGGAAMSVPADVSDPDQIDQAVRAVTSTLGPVDFLVNNAGVVWPAGPTLDLNLSQLEQTFAINVLGPIRLTLAVVPGMLERSFGRIVNLSSGAAANPNTRPGLNIYASTKAALEAHTLNLAVELEDTGVTINILRPGSVDTSMQEWVRNQPVSSVGESLHGRFTKLHNEGWLSLPERPAAALIETLAGIKNGQIVDLVAGPEQMARSTTTH